MKKLILMLAVLMASITENVQANFIKLGGVEVHVERGKKEWNADHTATFCVGKGICVFTIKANIDIGQSVSTGILGNDQNGRFGLAMPAESIRNSYWSETFIDGTLTIYQDITLDNEIRAKIRNCPATIAAGRYKYIVEDGTAIVYFN